MRRPFCYHCTAEYKGVTSEMDVSDLEMHSARFNLRAEIERRLRLDLAEKATAWNNPADALWLKTGRAKVNYTWLDPVTDKGNRE